MNQDSSVLDAIIQETIANSEEFLGVFSNFVADLNVQILEVLRSLGVLFAGDIEHVSNAFLNQILSFEGRLVWSHENSWVDLEKVDFF
jgi:hypothetical protein